MFWKKKENSMIKSQPIEKGYKREVGGVALSALFIFLALALISHNPHDNSLFHYANTTHHTTNWAGIIGAHTSALLFFLFGASAFLFLCCIGIYVWLLFKGTPLKQERGRIASLFLIMLSATPLCSLLHIDFIGKAPGGFIGNLLSKVFTVALGFQGSLVLLFSTLWIGTILLTKIQLIPLVKAGFSKLWGSCKQVSMLLWQKINRPKKSSPEQAPQPTTITIEQEVHDFAFLGSVSDGAIDVPPTESQQEPEAHSRWTTMQLRTASQPQRLLKGFVYRLPNSVSKKNFLADENFVRKINAKEMNAHNIRPEAAYKLPQNSLFTAPREKKPMLGLEQEVAARGKLLEEKLLHFGVKGKVTSIKTGPFITLFEYKPEIDSKISKITALEDDLAMALTAMSIRILAPIPGKDVVGFEIANAVRQDVYFSEILTSKEYREAKTTLPLVFGVDVAGNPIIQDLVRMPHLLIGGSTGSGKSVGLNAIIAGLLNTMTPDTMKLILVDPKRLEFTPYADVPHLVFPIITEPAKATSVLKWVCQDMEARYATMAKSGVRNIQEYHKLFTNGATPTDREGNKLPKMPFLVVVIDELADLMMVAGKEIEMAIVRIAQMARASGIHMIVATQRPSVDVVTGLIKVNFPSRIAFRVSSKVDSRTILDQQGAEKLLGRGDMLYLNASSPDIARIHGAYVSDKEIHNLTQWWREQQEPTYLDLHEVLKATGDQKPEEYQDELYTQVLEFIKTNDEISISMIQRYFRIGFNRSARLIEKLEMDGILAPSQGAKPRKVLR